MNWLTEYIHDQGEHIVDNDKTFILDRDTDADKFDEVRDIPELSAPAIKLTREQCQSLMDGKVLTFRAYDEYTVVVFVE